VAGRTRRSSACARAQLAQPQRRGQVAVGALRKAGRDKALFVRAAGQHHRQVMAERAPHPRQHIQCRDSRRFAIEDQQVERLGVQRAQQRAAAQVAAALVAVQAQGLFDADGKGRIGLQRGNLHGRAPAGACHRQRMRAGMQTGTQTQMLTRLCHRRRLPGAAAMPCYGHGAEARSKRLLKA